MSNLLLSSHWVGELSVHAAIGDFAQRAPLRVTRRTTDLAAEEKCT